MTFVNEPLRFGTYRDMQLLHEIEQTPHVTQRDLAKRIGVALGLANLMLRRLSAKGYVKILDAKKGKIRYLITPEGSLEKNRLALEFMRYSLHLYGDVRRFLREQFSGLAKSGRKRIVLCGTDELAEIACLTVQETGLELVGVADEFPQCQRFLGYAIQGIGQMRPSDYDWFILISLRRDVGAVQHLVELGVPQEKIISLVSKGLQEISLDRVNPRQSVPFLLNLTPEETDVVVLCGGRGARLGPLTAHIPKPLLPVGGQPFLLRLLLRMKEEGFTRFVLAAHHLSDQFRSFVATYAGVLPNVQLVVEPEPLGTGGALRHAATHVRSATFVVFNGDSWVSQMVAPVLANHRQIGRAFTVVAVQAGNVEGGALKKGVWRIGSQGEVVGFATEESVSEGWVNAGIYVLERAMVSSWPTGRYSLEANLPSLLNGREAGVFCSSGRLLDIGTPDCYERANHLFAPESAEAAVLSDVGEVGILGR